MGLGCFHFLGFWKRRRGESARFQESRRGSEYSVVVCASDVGCVVFSFSLDFNNFFNRSDIEWRSSTEDNPL